jgi:hypothetical protein
MSVIPNWAPADSTPPGVPAHKAVAAHSTLAADLPAEVAVAEPAAAAAVPADPRPAAAEVAAEAQEQRAARHSEAAPAAARPADVPS